MPRTLRALAATALLLCLVSACKDTSSEPPKPVQATPVNAATAGSVSARVRYTGPVPPPQPINMASAPGCAKLHSEPVVDPTLAVNQGSLANAVVYIRQGLENWVFAPPENKVVIDQKGCLYEPRVSAAMVGQAVEFLNSDPEAHNVHGRASVVPAWNFMMSRQGQERVLYFDKPELGIQVGCDIHPWMRAYLSIVPNPYFAVTGADGSAQFRNVPPGQYVIGVWHESLGTQEQPVVLPPQGELSVSFTYQGK